MTNDHEWLQRLKPGDAVAVPRLYGHPPFLLKVERITPTQIVCERDSRFRRRDGRSVRTPTSWGGHDFLVMATQEVYDRIELANLQVRVTAMRGKLGTPQTTAECKALIAALEPFMPKNPQKAS